MYLLMTWLFSFKKVFPQFWYNKFGSPHYQILLVISYLAKFHQNCWALIICKLLLFQELLGINTEKNNRVATPSEFQSKVLTTQHNIEYKTQMREKELKDQDLGFEKILRKK